LLAIATIIVGLFAIGGLLNSSHALSAVEVDQLKQSGGSALRAARKFRQCLIRLAPAISQYRKYLRKARQQVPAI